jgi:DNA-directed RNA polymerase subunit beta
VSTPIYLSAERRRRNVDCQANIKMDNSGKITAENVIARMEGDFH